MNKRLMIAGTGSGCGKTTVSCAFLAALKQLEKTVVSFKCGPDYVDPMFHKKATEIDAYNLDLFLMGETQVKSSLAEHSLGKDISIIEGVMGFYDGIGENGEASAHEVSMVTGTPVLLVVNVRGKAQSVCAEISGYLNFKKNHIVGIILNQVSEGMVSFYQEMIERSLEIPVVGFLPKLPEMEIGSRHLGLITADEIEDIRGKMKRLGEVALRTFKWEKIMDLAQTSKKQRQVFAERETLAIGAGPRIYIAKDEAFCFSYDENHEILLREGAQLYFFSPLRDKKIPDDADGIILWGGYPELYGKTLSENSSMHESILRCAQKGKPIYAEGGGFVYLQEELSDFNGEKFSLVGLLKGKTKMANSLQKFGYIEMETQKDSVLGTKGTRYRAHSFHYYQTDREGTDCQATKASNGVTYPVGVIEKNIFGSLPQCHFGGESQLIRHFLKCCEEYLEE